jgi:prephenate dehydrogenase
MPTATIIGYGRFGALLASLASSSFDLTIVETDPAKIHEAEAAGFTVKLLAEATNKDFVFLAVPIAAIESTLRQIAPLISKDQVVVDLCSVKVYPISLMKRYLPDVQIIGTHPMFGPDSAKGGIHGLQVAICPVNASAENLTILKQFWTGHGGTVIETTPEAHDQDAVYSQAFTYSLAKIIHNMDLPPITFKTKSFSALVEVARLSANDSEQLFHDMLFYNPYFSSMKTAFEGAITQTNMTLADIASEQANTQSH